MSVTSLVRRRFMQLAVMGVPATLAATWFAGDPSLQARSAGSPRIFRAHDGIRWEQSQGAGGLLLPLGLGFAMLPGSVSPDGRYLAYTVLDRRTGSNIWTVPLDVHAGRPTAGTPVPFFHAGTFDLNPRFSADGTRIAYVSCAAGRWSFHERAFMNTREQVQAARTG